MRKSLKEKAEEKLNDAYDLMKKSGYPERFIDVAEQCIEWKELKESKYDFVYEILNCSICSGGHTCEIEITKEKGHSWQYQMEMSMTDTYDWPIWWRIRHGWIAAKEIIFKKKMTQGVCLRGDDLTKFKDVLKRMP